MLDGRGGAAGFGADVDVDVDDDDEAFAAGGGGGGVFEVDDLLTVFAEAGAFGAFGTDGAARVGSGESNEEVLSRPSMDDARKRRKASLEGAAKSEEALPLPTLEMPIFGDVCCAKSSPSSSSSGGDGFA